MTFVSFPSIEQFRTVVRNVKSIAQYVGRDENDEPIYNPLAPLPTISFRGTVKLHGTNAGIVLAGDGVEFQSRSRTLSAESDNAGFWAWGNQHLDTIEDMLIDLGRIGTNGNFPLSVAVYGEWCGRGIQRGVALNDVDRMFVVFAVKVDDVWLNMDDVSVKIACMRDQPKRIFPITFFDKHFIDIDFNQPELATNRMVAITEQVEQECPVGRYFGVSGVGEGVVWTPADPDWNSSKLWFKVKGEKHSVSKVKTLAAVDVEKIAKINDFVDYAVTENRLLQGLHVLTTEMQKPFEMTAIGDFIRWVFNDITKEESDVIAENGLDQKAISSSVANKSKRWFIERLNAKGC